MPIDRPFEPPRVYEPILLPDDSSTVTNARRDQATISLDRALLPVEPEPPNPFGRRVPVDTQATADPRDARTDQDITQQLRAERYETGRGDEGVEPDVIEIEATETGGVQPPPPNPLGPVYPPEVTAAATALQQKAMTLFDWAKPRLATFSADQVKQLVDLEAKLKAVFQRMGTLSTTQFLILTQEVSADIDAVQAALTSPQATSGGVPWLLIGAAAVGAWLLLRK